MQSVFNRLKTKVLINKYFLFLTAFYFVIRLINLTKFPIFNDEAIYLDWGWRETHVPGYLYYSLYDAKQPLLMWLFGIAEHLLPDPLFAGRIVSVIFGFLTLFGIYKISKTLFNKNIALLAVFIYALVPLFSFYDRQALMESAISAVGIWAGYFLLKLIESKNYKYTIILGVILGLGFFIKSSALVFMLAFLISVTFLIKLSFKKIQVLEIIITSLFVFISVNLLLIINPQFWSTLSSNSRFTLTPGELLSLPVNIWVSSLVMHVKISFFYLTPFLFISSLIGAIYIFKISSKHKLFLLYFFISFLLATFLVKGGFDRYVISFLPFLVICSSYSLFLVFEKDRIKAYILFLFCLILPLMITLYQIINFPGYILAMGKVSGYSHPGYLDGFTSGYGVNQAVSYFENLSKKQKFVIGIAENTGNPESAFQIYFNKNKNATIAYMDSKLFGTDLSSYDCILTGINTYFVARDNQQAGLERFFTKIKEFRNPYGTNWISVYTLKKDCKGKTLNAIIGKTFK